MRYTWDPAKNAANIRKHGISFERAVRIFDGPLFEQIDDRYDYGEIRINAIGIIESTEVFVAFTEKGGEERRIISARKADRKEREEFWHKIGPSHG
jgi:uncharacterized DUF497 family protein